MAYSEKIYKAAIICFVPIPTAIITLTNGVVQLIGILVIVYMGYALGKMQNKKKAGD